MNELKRTTFVDRLRRGFKAFKGEPFESIQLGLDIKRCDECDYKNIEIQTFFDEYIPNIWLRKELHHTNMSIDRLPYPEYGDDGNASILCHLINYRNSIISELTKRGVEM